jgi:hypothetical protein
VIFLAVSKLFLGKIQDLLKRTQKYVIVWGYLLFTKTDKASFIGTKANPTIIREVHENNKINSDKIS